MNRRTFLSLGLVTALGAILAGIYGKSGIRRVGKRIFDWTKPAFKTPSASKSVSVEAVLNSRCNSDWDGDPCKFHWGMFDPKKRLPKDIIEKIMTLSRVPRLTDREIRIHENSAILSFRVPNEADERTMSWLMVESGMQQQSVGLTCAALGVGMVFSSRGRDGKLVSKTEIETTTIKLGSMKPSYDGSFWTREFPGNHTPWLPGNLSDPIRDGPISFFPALPKLKAQYKTSRTATEISLSQLLWAARGRTPHLYNSKPWGMTIPTWRGKQDISSVYLVSEKALYRYMNWIGNQPTHSLLQLNTIGSVQFKELLASFSADRALIVVGKNEPFAMAFWEAGYQLLNMLLQASSLDISYTAFLLNENEKKNLEKSGIVDPIVVLAF